MGSRYGGLKQMDSMGPNGETVLDYSVYDAIRAGFEKIIFIIREDFADEFKEKVGSKFADQIAVDYVFQDLNDLPEGYSLPEGRVKPWGTSHAIRAARNVIDGPFAVINADDFYGQDAYKQIATYFSDKNADSDKDHYCLIGYPIVNTLSDHGSVNRGICTNDGQLLKEVEEVTEISRQEDGTIKGTGMNGQLRDVPESSIASMNFWGFPANFLDKLEAHFIEFLKEYGNEMKSECFIPTVVDEQINLGAAECEIIKTSAIWFGVTYPEDKAACVDSINKLIEAGEYPTPLS
ncbi:nucleotidyltransferase [Persicirhabdus sediminis]|uniref:Nucleotidyltransferase n=2 Tax=Persicirhabdus sediminis TaxID=454144 RepID=A0A8J7MDT2_9BACT|nr:nucleotidyltransferase [Persicirhabdus sediminis]